MDYDLLVIGGGSGGVRAARRAADTGARVALAEMSKLGGTCVQRGCVPKKLMVFASEYGPAFEEARRYGWRGVSDAAFDWGRFKPKLRGELERLEETYRGLLTGSGVTIHDARAVLKDAHTVVLSGGETVTAEHILIATGGQPFRPDMPGADLGIVSDDMFELDELPERLLIVGGGYIACEFASMMNGMGVEVHLFQRSAQILRGFDDEARGVISEGMRDRGVNFHFGCQVAEMRREDGRIRARGDDGEELLVDQVLFATGRTPNTDDMGLEDAGVALGAKGEVKVDRFSRSSVPSIWAIGDVTDRIQLTPVAIREAMAFVRTVFGGVPTAYDHDDVPSAVFTQPEMGNAGLTEEQARAQGLPLKVFCSTLRPMRTSFIGDPERVLLKLVVHGETDRILGVHLVAPSAGEMIQFAGIAVKAGVTKAVWDETCAVHPTIAEEIVTMSDPVRAVGIEEDGTGKVDAA